MKQILLFLAFSAAAFGDTINTNTPTTDVVSSMIASGTVSRAQSSGDADTLNGYSSDAFDSAGAAATAITAAQGYTNAKANAAQAYAIQRANHTGTQSASTIGDFAMAAQAAVTWSTLSGKPTLAPVATTGSYGSLLGLPAIPTTLPATGGTAATITGTIPIAQVSGAATAAQGTLAASAAQMGYGVVTVLSSTSSQIVFSGTTDATRGAALASAIAAAKYGDQVLVGPGNYYISTVPIQIASGVNYRFFNSYVYITGSTTCSNGSGWAGIFSTPIADFPTVTDHDYSFDGPLTMDGKNITLPGGTTRAFLLYSGSHCRLSNINVLNFVTSGMGTPEHSSMTNCYAYNCGMGFNNGQYTMCTDCMADTCGIGFLISLGNGMFSDCVAVSSGTGVAIINGGNPGHGVWSGGLINHNAVNLYVDPTLFNGFTFTGTYFLSGSMTFGGDGIQIIGGQIGNGDYPCAVTGTMIGYTVISGVRFESTSATSWLRNLTTAQKNWIKLVNCDTVNGPYTLTPEGELWGSLIGTGTNDSATAGHLGEYVTAQLVSGSSVTLISGTATTITSVTLTPGDWEVSGVVDYDGVAASVTAFKTGVATTPGTFGAQDTFQNMPFIAAAWTDEFGHTIAPSRLSLSGTSTAYLIGEGTFSSGTVTAHGTIRARRVR